MQSIQYVKPFVYIDGWGWGFGFKPVLISFLLFVVLYVFFLIKEKYTKNKKGLKYIIPVYVVALIINILNNIDNQFIDEESNLYKIAKGFLQYEFIGSIILLIIWIAGYVCIKENKHTFINLINRIIVIFMSSCVLCNAITNTVVLDVRGFVVLLVLCTMIYDCNIPLHRFRFITLPIFILHSMNILNINNLWEIVNVLVFISLLVFTILLSVFEFEEKENKKVISPYDPINDYKLLFSSNRKKADAIKNIIEKSPDRISICLSGEWGSGKTSIINCVISELEESNKYKNLYIRINALEIDDINSLFKYFFGCVKRYLKENRVYTGISSEYQKFISSAVGIITNETFANLFSAKMFNTTEDYRRNKENLSKLLSNVLNGKKIIVVVDDIERCNSKKVMSYIFFIKEVASLPNCITIFATDYDKLLENCEDINKDEEFFDKFFNYRIEVVPPDIYEMANELEKKFKDRFKDETLEKNGILVYKIEEPIKFFIDNYDKEKKSCIDRLQQAEKNHDEKKQIENQEILNNIKKHEKQFINYLSNPRKMVKIVCNVLNNYSILYDEYNKKIKDYEYTKILIKYIEDIKIEQLIFFIAFIEVCLPEFYLSAIKSSFSGYFKKAIVKQVYFRESNNSKEKFDETFVKYLTYIIICNDNDYRVYKKTKFLDNLTRNKNEMSNIVNGFTTQETEWINAIKNNKLCDYKNDIEEILNAVISEYGYKDVKEVKEGKEYVDRIFEFSREQKIDKIWDYIFIDKIGGARRQYLSSNYKLFYMKNFYENFCKINTNCTAEKNISENINMDKMEAYSLLYAYYIFSDICSLLKFIGKKSDVEIDQTYDAFTNSNIEIKERITKFVKRNDDIVTNEEIEKATDPIKKLQLFAKEIIQQLNINNCNKYPEIIDNIEKMNSAIEDVEYFIKIYDFVSNTKNKKILNSMLLNNVTPENINDWLKCFNTELSKNVDITTELRDETRRFFKLIRNDSTLELDQNTIEELHNVLDEYYKKEDIGVLGYRGDILNIKKKEEKRSEKNV